jgi:DNA modification methylase
MSHAPKTAENFKDGLVGSGFIGDNYDLPTGKVPESWWKDIINHEHFEAICNTLDEYFDAPADWIESAIAKRYKKGTLNHVGYPTEKPAKLLERLIMAACPESGVVADFFVGGGVTPMVAQNLGRRWVGCDQSRVAVAITADRITKSGEQPRLDTPPPP